MKNQFLILTISCLMASFATRAQETDTLLKSRYERTTLMLEGNKNKYRKDKEWKKIGLFKPKIEREFASSSPESRQELKAFRKQRKRGSALLIAGGVVFGAAVVVAPFVALPVFVGTFGTGLGTYLVGAFDLQKSRRHLQEAVWLHNRDVIAML